MDYKERYFELLEKNILLEKELSSLRSDNHSAGENVKENGRQVDMPDLLLEELHLQSEAFEKFADMLPEIIYEIDLSGNISYSNKQGLEFFGYKKEDLKSGIKISEVFPDSYQKMAGNLKSLVHRVRSQAMNILPKKKMEVKQQLSLIHLPQL